MKGLREGIQDLARDNRGWVALGQVTAVTQHADYGLLFEVVLRPSGRGCQARLAAMGAGDGAGMLWPVRVDDEVLVLFPDGDPNAAVLLPGLASRAASIPGDWSNDTVRVEAADRDVELRAGSGGSRAEVLLDAGTGAVTITSGDIKLGSSAATDFAALASLVLAELNTLRAEVIAHTHASGIGPTGPALGVGPTSNSVAATKVRAE